MIKGISHFALAVDDLQKAEAFYRQLFDMSLIGRESLQADGEWYTLPFDKTWQDAQDAEVELNMVALRKDNLVLALFHGEVSGGEQRIIGLNVSQDEIDAIRGRLTPEITLMNHQVDHLDLIDPYQVRWQIGVNPVFQTAGEFAGRWLLL